MNEPVMFVVYGEPSPQAGMRSVPVRKKGGGFVTGANGMPLTRQVTTGGKDLKSWRQELSDVAKAERDRIGVSFSGPVRLEVQFRFTMPKSRPAWAKVQRFLLRTTKPDLDKLVRAVGDSLTTSGLIGDDASICQLKVSKLEVHDAWQGAVIRVTQLDQRTFNADSTW